MSALLVVEEHDRLQQPDSAEPGAHQSLHQTRGGSVGPFHELRHTCASLLLGEGVHPKIVSELLGHSDITVTLNLYSHVLPTMQQQAVDTLDGLLSEPLVVKEVVNQASE